MFIKYGSTKNLKQFAKTLSKHTNGSDFTCDVVGTVKVHGMGVGFTIDADNREVIYKLLEGPHLLQR